MHLESIAWDLRVKTVSNITNTTINSHNHIKVTIKPFDMEYKDNDNVRKTMKLAVYASIEYSAEIKGACIHTTHSKAQNSLGLRGGKFHGSRAIA